VGGLADRLPDLVAAVIGGLLFLVGLGIGLVAGRIYADLSELVELYREQR
jgi:hypothetical protein